jgi:molybdate transport system permease protein
MEINLFPLFLSLKIAAISTIMAILAGVPIAFLLSRKKGKIWDFLDTLVNMPVVMPPTVLGYYLLILLGRRSFIGKFLEDKFDITIVFTQTGAVIAALIVSLPYIIKTSKSAFVTVNQDYINAAKIMGVSELKIFLNIILPLSSYGVIAGITMGFVRALGDFGTTLMISGSIPDKTLTMPIAIYNSMQEGNSAMTNTLVMIMTITAVFILFILNTLERKMKRR